MNKPTQQQIIEAYKNLPPPVREFLADPDQLARVLTNIKNAHNLHVDMIGLVNESIGHLLLGLVSPSEFRDILKLAGIPEGVVNDIIKEINEKIFVPLREELRRPAGSESRPLAPTTSSGQASGMRKWPTAQMGRNEPLRNVLASVTKETKLLEDHEEPHIEFHKTAPPPPNLPGAIYHPPLPPKPYSSDPYREPIEP